MGINKGFRWILQGLLLLCNGITYGQSTNIGFFGKKVALGYSQQISLVHLRQQHNFSEHQLYAEFSTNRYQSLSAVFGYNKTRVPFGRYADVNNQFNQYYELDRSYYEVNFTKNGGYADYRTTSVGIRVNFYYTGKTFAAPVGFCQYLKADFIKVKNLNNHFTYEIDNQIQLTPEQIANATTSQFRADDVSVYSIGYGISGKKMLTRNLYIQGNLEANTNSLLMVFLMELDLPSGNTIEEDLRYNGKSQIQFKNLLVGGFGFGILL